jgi:CDP-diacylglycerol--glycerol-3-phosphate 3-phosphatidyltransferase
MIPVLWVFAWLKLPVYIGIGMILSFITDALDGYVARKLNQVSDFGSKFDSFVDNLLLPSALVWLWLFRPEIYQENLIVGSIAIIVYFSSLFVGIVKFRLFANLHLQFSRVASVFMYLFMSHALIANDYSPILFYIALGGFLISSLETLLLQLICSEVNEHMGSILLVLKNRKLG